MDKLQDLLSFFEKALLENNSEFFSYAWREKITNELKAEDKYCKLLKWLNNRISYNYSIINTFNPADKDKNYTNSDLKNYESACMELSMLLNLKYIILDDRCTTQMRDNVEYTICKLFNINYNENLKDYI